MRGFQLLAIHHPRLSIDMHHPVVPRRHVDMVVPRGRNIGMRALKDQQGFLLAKRFPLRVGAGHVTVDSQSFAFRLYHFHGQMRGDQFFAVTRYQRGEVIRPEKFH